VILKIKLGDKPFNLVTDKWWPFVIVKATQGTSNTQPAGLLHLVTHKVPCGTPTNFEKYKNYILQHFFQIP
jgi:hypothetical protein